MSDAHNLVPLPNSRVSFQKVKGGLSDGETKSYLSGKDAFQETEYVILRNNSQYAIARVSKEEGDGLFRRIVAVEIVASPDECHFAQDPAIDCANRSALARKARELNVASAETLIVEGAYGHVNFISRPSPVVIDVIDLVPPESRLYGLARRALELADLPPILLELHPINVNDVARGHPARAHLFPCRASGLTGPGATFYLDERPERMDWLLIGCERSEQIHRHFYGQAPGRVETCPKRLCVAKQRPTLIRCCLLEDEVRLDGLIATIPWNGVFGQLQATT